MTHEWLFVGGLAFLVLLTMWRVIQMRVEIDRLKSDVEWIKRSWRTDSVDEADWWKNPEEDDR